jgi:hypothetical protein
MSGRPKGFKDRILDEGTRIAGKAARAVLDDRRGQEVLAVAVGVAQRGRRRVGEVQDKVLHAVGLPTKADYEEVARSMARLKRKIRELSRQAEAELDLDGEGEPEPGEARADGADEGTADAGEEPGDGSDPGDGEGASKR